MSSLQWSQEKHHVLGDVHQSKKVFGNSIPIQFFILPDFQVIANVASNAQVYKYHNEHFETIEEAKAFCQKEFDGFCRGESLNV